MSRKCRGNLKKEDTAAIQDNYIKLLEELEPDYLSSYLYQQGIFDKNDMDEITSSRTRKEKATKLINCLLASGPDDAYSVFLDGLEVMKQIELVYNLKRSALIRARNEKSPSPQNIPRDLRENKKDPLVEELDRQFAEIQSLKEINGRLNTDMEDLKKENGKLITKIDDLKKTNVTLNATIEGLKNECDTLNSKIRDLNTENLNMSNMLAFEKTKNNQLQNSINNHWRSEQFSLYDSGRELQTTICKECQSDPSSRCILQFMSQIDYMLVSVLWTIIPNPEDKVWQEFLVYSAFWKLENTTLLLLDKKMDPNKFTTLKGDYFVTPKDEACEIYIEPCKYNIAMSPLMAAAGNANYTILQILLDAGADVNAKDELGDTALIYLCRDYKTQLQYYTSKAVIRKNKKNCLHILISKGANLDVKGSKGNTALMHCAANGDSKFIHSLSLKVVNTKVHCDAGRTALMYACFYKAELDSKCLQQLIQDSNINATDANGDTALLYSISKDNVALFTLLIQNKPDIYIQNKQGINALMLAAKAKSEVFLSMLLKQNPKLNEKDQDGNTALIMAAANKLRKDYFLCAKLLIAEKEIDCNSQNKNGETALMKVAQLCFVEGVQQLIDAGANVNLRDINGWTALKHARLVRSPLNDIALRDTIHRLNEAGAVE